VPVGWILQHREARLYLGQRYHGDTLGRGRVDRNAHGTEATIQEDLRKGASGGVADENGRRLDPADDRLEMGDDLRDGQLLNRCRVGVERLHLHLEPRVCRGEDAVAAAPVVLDPLLPAPWGHPEAMDQNDGVGGGRVAAHWRSFRHGDWQTGARRRQRARPMSWPVLPFSIGWVTSAVGDAPWPGEPTQRHQ